MTFVDICFVSAIKASDNDKINCIEGKKMHLKFSVKATNVQWFKDENKIEQNENISIKSEGRHHCVLVKHAKLSDAGKYMMVAGNVRKQTTVIVEGNI